MKVNYFKSIKFKVSISVGIIIIVSLIFLSAVIITKADIEYTESVQTSFNAYMDAASIEVTEEVEKYFLLLEVMNELEVVKDTSVGFAEKGRILHDMIAKDSRFQNITFIDKNGNNFTEIGTIIDLSQRPFFQASIKGSRYIMDPFTNPVTGNLSMYYSIPAYGDNGEIIGVIMAVLDGNQLSDVSRKIFVGQNHPLFINNKTGAIVGEASEGMVANQVNMKTDAVGEFKDVIAKVCRLETGYQVITDVHNGNNLKTLCSFRPIEGTDWSVIITGDYHYFFHGLEEMKITSLIVNICAFIFVIAFASFSIFMMMKPFKKVEDAIIEIASGNADLTKRLPIKTRDETGAIADAFNKFVEKLQNIVTTLKNQQTHLEDSGYDLQAATQDTTSSVTEILANIESVGNQITNQAASVEETSGTLNEITSNIASLERMIENQVSSVTQASAAVEQMIGNISSVNQSVEKMAGSFNALISDTQNGVQKQDDVNERIKQIEIQSEMLQEANEAISAIAEQTNLLAMNAAIEAAHAGEAGKGFSVVADEIRKLSETSSTQSKTIGEQLTNIRAAIETVVSSSGETRDAFDSVSKRIEETDQLVQHIKSAMAEQQEGSRQIGEALHAMNDNTVEVRSASQEMTEGSKAIIKEMGHLQDESLSMKGSMDEMTAGARKINETATALNDIVKNVQHVMHRIKDEVGQFTV